MADLVSPARNRGCPEGSSSRTGSCHRDSLRLVRPERRHMPGSRAQPRPLPRRSWRVCVWVSPASGAAFPKLRCSCRGCCTHCHTLSILSPARVLCTLKSARQQRRRRRRGSWRGE
ncbi:hypothetical protein E2C01_078082 [Portunus trituberculatus]|uniref:Uncharacterized protein n=1 Tax=Portunus trituberculatus TaxID=210409 RepID=A0A5B7IT65_PORTR|nr:hypothetical protein [Portunus trituberculatus]